MAAAKCVNSTRKYSKEEVIGFANIRQKLTYLCRGHRSSETAYFVQRLPFVRKILHCTGTVSRQEQLTVSSGAANFVQGLPSRQKQLPLYRDYRLITNSLLCTGTIVRLEQPALYRDCRSSGTAYFVQGLPSRQGLLFVWNSLLCTGTTVRLEHLTLNKDYRSPGTSYFVQALPSH